MAKPILSTWEDVSNIDPTINVSHKHKEKLIKKRHYSTSYSREKLFHNMASGKISIFKDYPAPLVNNLSNKKQITDALSTIEDASKFVKVRMGPSDTFKYRKVSDILETWYRGKAILGITDLHVRDTKAEKVIDVEKISPFNLLCLGSEGEKEQEMLTAVISTKNNLTDSHSDDPDVCNHCFFGKKIWLVWDTFEGLKNGLEDVERIDYYGQQAKFDIDTFLRLKSSCWFFVSEGETLFLPGNFTHKVITLEDYIGVGSFYVSLPGYIRTISRWLLHSPLWSLDDSKGECDNLVSDIITTTTNKIHQLRGASSRTKKAWGYDYINKSVHFWKKTHNIKTQNNLLKRDVFQYAYSELY